MADSQKIAKLTELHPQCEKLHVVLSPVFNLIGGVVSNTKLVKELPDITVSG